MPHREGESTAYRLTAIVGLVLLSFSLLSFLIVHFLFLLGIPMDQFAVFVSEPILTSLLGLMAWIGLIGDLITRRRDREEARSEYMGQQLIPQYRWRMMTWYVFSILAWALGLVVIGVFLNNASGTTLVQPAFGVGNAELSFDYTTAAGLYNAQYFSANLILFSVDSALFGITFYVFLIFTLMAYAPVGGVQITRWLHSIGYRLVDGHSGKIM